MIPRRADREVVSTWLLAALDPRRRVFMVAGGFLDRVNSARD